MASYSNNPDDFRRRFQQKILDKQQEILTKSDEDSLEKEKKEKTASPFSISNITLLSLAVAVFYFTDFFNVVVYDQRIYRIWFWVGSLAMMTHISILCFLAIYCNYINKIGPDDWEQRYPKAIPFATFSILVGVISLSIGLWPVWGVFSPLIFGILVLGIVITVAMFG